MFEWLSAEVSGSPLTYLVVFTLTATDVFFPLIPAETVVVAAAVLSAQGELLIVLVVLAAAAGAIVGDNAVYFTGRRLGTRAVKRFLSSEKAKSRLDWARRAIRARGPVLIVGGRFVPAGRTATTLAAGTLEMAYRRFFTADVVAAFAWAIYISMLGYVGGAALEDSLWLPLLVAFLFTGAVAAGVEAWRRYARARGS